MNPETSKFESSSKLIAKLIFRLANYGVVVQTLKVSDVFDSPNKEEIRLFVGAMNWLCSEGIIRHQPSMRHDYDSEGSYIYEDVVLTSKGFNAANFVILDDIRVCEVAAKIDNSGYGKAGELLGAMMGAFSKSVSS